MSIFKRKEKTAEQVLEQKVAKQKRKEARHLRAITRKAKIRKMLGIKTKVSRSGAGTFGIFIFVFVLAVAMSIPFIYAIGSSLKPNSEIFIFPPRLFPQNPTFDHFVTMFQLTSNTWVPFSRYVFNSLFVSFTATFFNVIFASMAGYPLSKHVFPGQKVLKTTIQWSLLFTAAVTAIPRYFILAKIGFINTYWAFIIPAIPTSLGLYLMIQFMSGIPNSLLEASRIDGANEFKIYWKVVMPMVKPAWLTLIIFSFQGIWGETGGSYIYDERLKTLPTVLNQMAAAGLARVGVGAAVTVFLMIPPLLIFILSQSSVIETMATSGIK